MTTPSRTPMAGGSLIALCLIGGVGIGIAQGQPTIGFLAGFGAGVLLALGVWLVDRRRG